MYYLLTFLNVFLVSAGQLLLKKGSENLSLKTIPQLIFNQYLMMGIVVYTVSTLVWMLILSKVKLSIAYPLMSLSYIVVMIGAYYFFGETIKYTQIIGTLLIIIGVTFLIK